MRARSALRVSVAWLGSLLFIATCAPPVVPQPPKDKSGDPLDCGALTRCDSTCVDLQKDPLSCGSCGRSCVVPNATAGCQLGACTVAACNDGFYDADKKVSNGCEATSICVAGSDCKTRCDSIGHTSCSPDGVASCTVPAESCNAQDDDCNGACDEGAIAGCRIGVYRSLGMGHLYTTDQTAATTPPYAVEAANYFYIYSAAAAGLRGLYLCKKGDGLFFITTSATCEVLAIPGTLLGYVAADARCDAVPLHRLHHPASNDHFYTLSEPERDNAINNFGYQSEGIAAFVFHSP